MGNNINQAPVLRAARALLPRQPIDLAALSDLLPRLANSIRLDTDYADVDLLPTSVLVGFPSVRVEIEPRPYASMTYWDPATRQWVVCLDTSDTKAEHRFSLAHELGHIIWHGSESLLLPNLSPAQRRELEGYSADLFAGQLLMPYTQLSRAYAQGVHEPPELAARFDVTEQAVLWRLTQTDMPLRSSDDIDAEIRPTDRERVHPLVEDAS